MSDLVGVVRELSEALRFDNPNTAERQVVHDAASVLARLVEVCPYCEGSGYGGNGGHEYNTQEEYEGICEHVCRICPVPCPSCRGGVRIKPDAIERAASVLAENDGIEVIDWHRELAEPMLWAALGETP